MFIRFQASIPRRTSVCALGGEPLVKGVSYVSHLCSLQEDEVKRTDYCEQCWQTVEKTWKEKEGIYWRGKIPTKKEEPIRHDAHALALFRECIKTPSACDQKLLTVLTLYLERKKQIEKRVEMKNQQHPKTCYYEILETGEVYPVLLSSLSREDSEKMLYEIKQKFSAPLLSNI